MQPATKIQVLTRKLFEMAVMDRSLIRWLGGEKQGCWTPMQLPIRVLVGEVGRGFRFQAAAGDRGILAWDMTIRRGHKIFSEVM